MLAHTWTFEVAGQGHTVSEYGWVRFVFGANQKVKSTIHTSFTSNSKICNMERKDGRNIEIFWSWTRRAESCREKPSLQPKATPCSGRQGRNLTLMATPCGQSHARMRIIPLTKRRKGWKMRQSVVVQAKFTQRLISIRGLREKK